MTSKVNEHENKYKVNEHENKYNHLQTLQTQHTQQLLSSQEQDRVIWETSLDEKSNLIASLDAQLQSKSTSLLQLKQTQENRINELRDPIVALVQKQFALYEYIK